MTEWTKRDRLAAVFAGEKADRPPLSAYTHEVAAERTGEALTRASLDYAKKWDWDWIKLNPRTVHYAEAWGNTYDYDNYPVPGLPIPAQTHAVINDVEDTWKIDALDLAANEPIQEQLGVIRDVTAGAPDTPVFATLYSPLNVFTKLAGIPFTSNAPAAPGSTSTLTIQDFIREDRAGLHHALHAIAETLAFYAEEQRRAGAEGLVFVIAALTKPDFLTEAEFNEFSRPYDNIVLDGAKGSYRVVHTCGAQSHPEWFQDYPLEGINWDHTDETNADFDAPLTKTKVGGVNHALLSGFLDVDSITDEVRREVTEARKAADDVLVVAPSCSIASTAPDEALSAYKEAVLD